MLLIFRRDVARRDLKASAIAFAFVLSTTVACQALSILNTIDDRSGSSETERFAMARTLALFAGQGRPALEAEFFLKCMDDAAIGGSPLNDDQRDRRRLRAVQFNCLQRVRIGARCCDAVLGRDTYTASFAALTGRARTIFRAGLALNVIGSLVKGLVPWRSFVAGFLITTNFAKPGTRKTPVLLSSL